MRSEYSFAADADAGLRHAILTSALDVALNVRLVGTPCQAVVGLAVRAPDGWQGVPDGVVFCEREQEGGALLTPMVVFEVLTPQSQGYDRGDKFAAYRSIPGLRHYLMVSSDALLVDHYARKGSDSWLLTTYRQRTDVLRLDPPGVEIPLEELYRRTGL